jgi:enediyne biosynthesis protein E4
MLFLLATGCSRTGAIPPAASGEPSTSRRPSHAIHFTDVTAAAGIRFRHTTGGFGRKLMPETMGSGCAFWDYDGDDRLDILLLNGRPLGGAPRAADPVPTLALYRNSGDGTFRNVTRAAGLAIPMYGMGCCAADYDNDGDADLYVTCALGPSHLFRNNGDGTFTDVTARSGVANAGLGRWGTSCAWLDYDRDGRLDLFVANYVRYDLVHDVHCAGPTGKKTFCTPEHYPGQPSVLYHNEGDGTFRDVSGPLGIGRVTGKALGVAVCDVDRDGWPDLYVANDTTSNLLFRSAGHGAEGGPGDGRLPVRFVEEGLTRGLAYAETGLPRAGMGVDDAEPLNDGRQAFLVSNFAGEGLTLFREDRDGFFLDATLAAGLREPTLRTLGFGLFFFDADNDGRPEIFVANGHIQDDIQEEQPTVSYRQPHQLFQADERGVYHDVSASAGPPFMIGRVSRGAAYGDYDNDGDLDLLVNNNGGAPELLRNDGAGGRHWLQVTLRGAASNRDALGAEVTLRAGGVTQRRRVRCGSSYCSQSMLRLHFGLGAATDVDALDVRWPGGRVERREHLPVDRQIEIEEGRASG